MDKGVPSVTEWHASDVLISFSKAGMKNGVINPKTVCMMWSLTKPEFLLEAYADDDEAEHVDDQMNNSGVEPHMQVIRRHPWRPWTTLGTSRAPIFTNLALRLRYIYTVFSLASGEYCTSTYRWYNTSNEIFFSRKKRGWSESETVIFILRSEMN